MKDKKASDCMTPLEKLFMLEFGTRMDRETMQKIKDYGHSRIPIYQGTRDNVKYLLLVKSLLFSDLSTSPLLKNLELREIPKVLSTINLHDLLNSFQTGRSRSRENVFLMQFRSHGCCN